VWGSILEGVNRQAPPLGRAREFLMVLKQMLLIGDHPSGRRSKTRGALLQAPDLGDPAKAE